jgi:hypothetical protein
MQLGTGLAFAGFAFLGASGAWRWVAFFSIPFMLNAVVLMATRGAFVGLLGGAMAALSLRAARCGGWLRLRGIWSRSYAHARARLVLVADVHHSSR